MTELKIEVLGSSFTISTDEDKAYLKKILEKYKAAIQATKNISGITDPLNVAILTGFILTDELAKAEKRLDEESKEVINLTSKLISNLDTVLSY